LSHLLDVRVYYEDTDHGGVVYHANYLKFMERGRTEALRALGFSQSDLAEKEDVLFALSRSDLRYLRPAKFDDALVVQTDLVSAKGARMVFKQQVLRDGECLVEADIHIACMNKAGRAKRIPSDILNCLEQGKHNSELS